MMSNDAQPKDKVSTNPEFESLVTFLSQKQEDSLSLVLPELFSSLQGNTDDALNFSLIQFLKMKFQANVRGNLNFSF
jgi:hypothetical protein